MYHLNHLRQARSQVGDLTDVAGADAAYEVASCLGKCRVSGTLIPIEEEGVLELELALKAALHAQWLTQRVKEQVLDILNASQDTPVESEDDFYDEDCRASCVRTRHELWCAVFAIQESSDAFSRDEEGKVGLVNELFTLNEKLADLDTLMIQHAEAFGCVVDLPLLSNLKASVKPELLPKLVPIPWWLDGTIEKALEQSMKNLMEWLPKPSEIEKRRQQC